MKQEEIISNYIEKILNIQDEALTEEDLKEIAFEQGLDEAGYLELQEVYKAHILRGKAFMKHENWEEAISEFHQALAINPLKITDLLAQSGAYEKWWQETGDERHKEEAVFYARRALKYDPNNSQAVETIGRIQDAKFSKGPTAKFWIFTLLILLIGGMLITFRAFKEKSAVVEGQESGFLEPEEIGGELAGDGSVFFSDLEVPIRFMKEGADEFGFIPSISMFKSRKVDYTYHLQGWLQVLEGEITTVVLEVRMLLKNGTSHSIKELTVFNKGSLPARTGDKMPFGNIIFQDKADPTNIEEVQILIHELGKVQAPESYEASTPIEVAWVKEVAKGIQIETQVRTYELKTSGSFPHAVLSLEAKNTGKIPISLLEFQIEWLDKTGKVIYTGNQFLVGSYSPALAPGETYISSRTYSLTNAHWQEITSYRVKIMRAWK